MECYSYTTQNKIVTGERGSMYIIICELLGRDMECDGWFFTYVNF